MAALMTMPAAPAVQEQTYRSLDPAMKPDKERLRAIVGRHEREAKDRESKRMPLEQRWIEALEQYHSQYDEKTQRRLNDDPDRSAVFMNETMQKTNAMQSRIKDLLFPTDDRNYGIKPTPVPKLTRQARDAVAQAEAMKAAAASAQQQAANQNTPQSQAMAEGAQKNAAMAIDAAKAIQDQIDEAKKRAEAMQQLMDDQLVECQYQAIKRRQIDTGVLLGTGVTKGPVVGERVRKGWKESPDGTFQLDISNGDQESPAFVDVDLWGFFPDMDVIRIEDGNGTYVRHLKNDKTFADMAELEGFDMDVITRLIAEGAKTEAPGYMAQLRNIRSAVNVGINPVFHVWDYTGPLSVEDVRDLAYAMANEGNAAQMDALLDEADNLKPGRRMNAVLWFCNGEPLKFAMYPYDSGATMFSVFCLVKDPSSIFGYGMPDLIKHPQAVINASWRMMLDNMGVTAGPQVVIDGMNIEPVDGSYKLKANKVWRAKNGLTKENPPFQIFNIDSHQAEIAAAIELAERVLDVMSGLPATTAGELPETMPQNTPVGTMIMVQNAGNIVFRNIIKNFDDDVTVKDMTGLYDWNMQFSPREDVKGDYGVDARGSSVLLAREMQSQNLMIIALQFGSHPRFGPMLKDRNVLRKLFQSLMIPADEVMLSDEEIDAVLAQAAAQKDIETLKLEHEQEKLQAEIQMKNMEWHHKLEIAKLEFRGRMVEAATRANVTLDQLSAKLDDAALERDHKDRAIAVEAAINEKDRQAAIETGQPQPGSGGYLP